MLYIASSPVSRAHGAQTPPERESGWGGAIPQGESRSAEVTLQSHRGEEFAVTGVETSADEVQVVGDASAYATSHDLTIGVSPAAEGTFGGEASFNVRTAAGCEVTVSVPVKGWVASRATP